MNGQGRTWPGVVTWCEHLVLMGRCGLHSHEFEILIRPQLVDLVIGCGLVDGGGGAVEGTMQNAAQKKSTSSCRLGWFLGRVRNG